ncbi:unnamed protein product [Vitrella brassicaformis CCMP3155]|uniref:Uncharacterized protein n=1 Tax=Vitrella brassicaformis (strain CCMP3155) TaxID=1169540 RepID=A0A0G4ED62_VITBC|nr:unnamed protein product [Vitrella brassicaformis CCMP3155]|eukprot:CEL93622.1 unnamed protein product [Vitrella brassicaformis CCMP3155]
MVLAATLLRVRSARAGHPQHPLTHLFVGDDQSCLLDLSTILQLRATARCFSEALSSAQLRSRLHTSIARSGIDTQLVQFNESLCGGTVVAALWIAEEGGQWNDGTGDVLRLADHCGACTLPVVLTAEDINTHANKTVRVCVGSRVIAQLKMVGRHTNFGDGVTFQLFQHGDMLRALKDEPGFELTLDPLGLPADHLYRRHRQDHDPPASSRIHCFLPPEGWEAEDDDIEISHASVSQLAKDKILNYHDLSRPDEEREIGNFLSTPNDVNRAMSDADIGVAKAVAV